MKRTVDNIQLPMFPTSVTELLDIKKPPNSCFIRAMDIDSINVETMNFHYTVHQFWEQEGPLQMLWRFFEPLSLTPKAYNKNSSRGLWAKRSTTKNN